MIDNVELPDNVNETTLANIYKLHFLRNIGLEDSEMQQFDNYIDLLQKDIITKSQFARLGGEIGRAVHICLFLVVLKQKGNLLDFMSDFTIEGTVSDYTKSWLECVKIRTISRNLQTSRELKELFRKMLFILSVEPGNAYVQFPQLNGMGGLPSMSMSSNFQLEDEPHLDDDHEHKQATQANWNKVKNYLSKLRKQKALRDGKSGESLVALLLLFLEMQIDISKIFALLEARGNQFSKMTQLLELMKTLILSCKDSILASEILSAFSKIFRSNQQELKSLTINYNGLPIQEATKQIQVVKSIIESFVSNVCNDQIP